MAPSIADGTPLEQHGSYNKHPLSPAVVELRRVGVDESLLVLDVAPGAEAQQLQSSNEFVAVLMREK